MFSITVTVVVTNKAICNTTVTSIHLFCGDGEKSIGSCVVAFAGRGMDCMLWTLSLIEKRTIIHHHDSRGNVKVFYKPFV